jgi:hypothetical protein
MPKQGTRASSINTTTTNLLLDDVTGASFAYSLRKLRNNYTGYAIRLRNAGGSTQDIGFVGNNLDTSAVTTFANGGVCYVDIWYDQSGNGYDLSDTSGSNNLGFFPAITDNAGAIYTSNGLPTLWFSTGRRLWYNPSTLSTSVMGSTSGTSAFAFSGQTNSSKSQHAIGGMQYDANTRFIFMPDYSNIFYYDSGNATDTTSGLRFSNANPASWEDNPHIVTGFSTGSTMYIDVDGTNLGSASRAATITHQNCRLTMGTIYNQSTSAWSTSNVASIQGYIQEFIWWPTNKFSDRTTINNNLANYW